jgi:hypothetical protein
MQSIEQFMALRNVKNKNTVLRWINSGYIPGTILDKDSKEYKIPDNARCPYVERGNCKGNAIYRSIVKASAKGKHVVYQLYDLPKDEFDFYIKCLIEWKYIVPFELEGITYYNATEAGEDFASWRNSQVGKFLKDALPLLSFGILSFLALCIINSFLNSIEAA